MTRAAGGFSQEDRDKITKLLDTACSTDKTVKELKETVATLQGTLKNANEVIDKQSKYINHLHTKINASNYFSDANNQYPRREHMKVRIKKATPELGDDPERIVEEIAKEIESVTRNDKSKETVHINLDRDKDIQRCHFLGNSKQKIVCRFTSYKQRMKFMRNKKIINSATSGKFKEVFIGEDLTPMRGRLVWYMHEKLNHKFHNIHTLNGTIRCKKDPNDRKWIQINNPDDLFKHLDDENEFDLELFNEGLHCFKILSQNPFTSFLSDE